MSDRRQSLHLIGFYGDRRPPLALRGAVRKFPLPLGTLESATEKCAKDPTAQVHDSGPFRSSEAAGFLPDPGNIRQWHLSAIGR
jgi:hypothetical protein